MANSNKKTTTEGGKDEIRFRYKNRSYIILGSKINQKNKNKKQADVFVCGYTRFARISFKRLDESTFKDLPTWLVS